MLLGFPSIVSIESNLHCNGMCRFCIRDKITRERGVMSLDIAEKIASQLNSETQVIINSWNEPLMNTNFELLLAIFNYSKIMFYTNGSLLHRRNIFDAIDECEAINAIYVSFNGGDEQGYEATMGIPFKKTKENVEKLFRIVDGRFPINITANMTDENRNGINKIREMFPDAANIDIHYPWDVRGFRGKQQPIEKIKPCERLNYYMAVAWDGTVQACCNMINNEIVFGHVKDSTLKEIWLSDAAKHFRAGHERLKRSEISVCARCRG